MTDLGPVPVRLLGEGPPVLCVHGAFVDSRIFNGVASLLAGEATVLLPTCRRALTGGRSRTGAGCTPTASPTPSRRCSTPPASGPPSSSATTTAAR
jgi:hypothetical protein